MFAAIELRLRRLIQLGTEQRKGREFAVLRQIQTQRSGHLAHGFDLRAAAHAAHRKTDVDGRPYVGVEQIGQQEDLAVGDGNHVGRNVGGNVAGLRFDDREARSAIRRPSSSFSFAARSSRRLWR